MATRAVENLARKGEKARRRNERRRQERQARPPTERQAAYDRDFDAWIALVGGGASTEVDRSNLRPIYAKARRREREHQRHRGRVEAKARAPVQLHGALEDTTIDADLDEAPPCVDEAPPLPSPPRVSPGLVVLAAVAVAAAAAAAAAAGAEAAAGVEPEAAAVGEVAVEAETQAGDRATHSAASSAVAKLPRCTFLPPRRTSAA